MLERKCCSSSSNSLSCTSSASSSGSCGHEEAGTASLYAEVQHVLRDMTSMRVANDGIGYESRVMLMLPDCLRLKSEVSECRR